MKTLALAALSAGLILSAAPAAFAQDAAAMTFFVTSVGTGDGANLGGLTGADAHCQKLATDAGAGARTWHAYLGSSQGAAKDRIGAGPWQNIKGDVIATGVDDLHSDNNKITKQTALTEKGEIVPGRGDTPNKHDILTGANPDGTANENTCNDWTLNGEGAAMTGHSDRTGLDDSAAAKSWNSSHPSRGCSQENLRGTGGDGFFYCFATN